MSHKLADRNPMSECRRQHIHGALLPIDRPEGEPSYLGGVLLLVAVFTIATLAIVAFTGGGQ
jgi:hypothetical protein